VRCGHGSGGDHDGSHASLDHRKRTVPASASLSIPALADQLAGVELPDPVVLAPALSVALATVVDPRQARGLRHRLVVLLTAAVCAVAAGARSFVAVGEWVADLPGSVAETLGTSQRCPSESTIRRAARDIDPDAFDTAIGRFVQQLCAAVAPTGRRRVLAVDGKTVRGSRHTDRDGNVVPGRHLLAMIDQHTRVVLGQVDVETKTNEITAFTPLLDTLTGITLSGVVVTADAHWTGCSRSRATSPGCAASSPRCPGARSTHPPRHRNRARPPGDPHAQTRHHRHGDRVPARHPGHPDHPPHPPGPRRQGGQVAHRNRIRDHRPGPSPGPTRRARRLDPRALADRKRPALGP
jgi:DDE_Tnp_1-associated/Transposase DDE domain